MAVFLARMVMPRSRSRSFESITRSMMCSLERNVPLCCSMASTSVVLPWSTWAIMAILRMLELKGDFLPDHYLLSLYYGFGRFTTETQDHREENPWEFLCVSVTLW